MLSLSNGFMADTNSSYGESRADLCHDTDAITRVSVGAFWQMKAQRSGFKETTGELRGCLLYFHGLVPVLVLLPRPLASYLHPGLQMRP